MSKLELKSISDPKMDKARIDTLAAPALSIENLSVNFTKQRSLADLLQRRPGMCIEAVKDATLSIAIGETVALVGESGSGKTTFLKCLAGLEKINSGKIELNSVVLNDKDTFIAPNKRKIAVSYTHLTLPTILRV